MSNKYEEGYASYMQGLLKNGSSRGALKYADKPGYAPRAYPLLARYWGEKAYNEIPVLYASAAIARSQVKHKEGVSLGSFLYKVGITSGISQESLQMKITNVYNQPIERAHSIFVPLLTLGYNNNISLDYGLLLNTYLYWDKDPSEPRSTRRRFLNDFFRNSMIEEMKEAVKEETLTPTNEKNEE
jgi:CRISPR type I-E-associated protein CasB/Cse2